MYDLISLSAVSDATFETIFKVSLLKVTFWLLTHQIDLVD